MSFQGLSYPNFIFSSRSKCVDGEKLHIYTLNYCVSSFSHFLNYLRHTVFRILTLTRGCPIYLCHFLDVIHLFADNSPPPLFFLSLFLFLFTLSFLSASHILSFYFPVLWTGTGFQCGSGSQMFRSMRIQTQEFDTKNGKILLLKK
jgi:hypothetical protein